MFAIPRGHTHCENNLVVDFVIRHCVSMCYILYIQLMLLVCFVYWKLLLAYYKITMHQARYWWDML